jgi:hypothetical protein
MKKFEFEMTIAAPTENEAIRKMNALQALGKHLSLSELEALEKTVSSPTMLVLAKQKLGLN